MHRISDIIMHISLYFFILLSEKSSSCSRISCSVKLIVYIHVIVNTYTNIAMDAKCNANFTQATQQYNV